MWTVSEIVLGYSEVLGQFWTLEEAREFLDHWRNSCQEVGEPLASGYKLQFTDE